VVENVTARRVLDQSVLIPMGVAASLAIGIGGGSFWLSAMFQKVEATSTSVSKMEEKLEVLAGMRTDIEVIKTKLETMQRSPAHASARNPQKSNVCQLSEQGGAYSMTE
jgi:hypothetical protein